MSKKQAPQQQQAPLLIDLPNAVSVIGKRFTVHCEGANSTPSSPLDRNDMGACMVNSLKIYIKEGYPLPTQQDTLLHEVIHAIDESLYLGMTEQQVSNMATVLLDTLRRNPHLTAYLLQD